MITLAGFSIKYVGIKDHNKKEAESSWKVLSSKQITQNYWDCLLINEWIIFEGEEKNNFVSIFKRVKQNLGDLLHTYI